MIDATLLHRLLTYDPQTGVLTWRERPSDLFASPHAANSWNSRLAGSVAFPNINRTGYMKGMIFGRTYMAHRVIWALMSGEWPPATMDIDHINGVKTDNRWANLRLATRQQNSFNRKPRTGRRFRGVYERDGSWHARCKDMHGRVHDQSGYRTEDEAAAAYDRLATKFHGPFARPNYPEARL